MCLDQDGAEEECRLSPKTTAIQGVSVKNGGRKQTLYSPGFRRQNNLNRYFCVYNISLNCPGHRVSIANTERSMPFQSDCRDYLAIYTDTDNNVPERKICRDHFQHLRMNLSTNNFVAILWTDLKTSTGRFEIEATCGEPIPANLTTGQPEEGSGANLSNV